MKMVFTKGAIILLLLNLFIYSAVFSQVNVALNKPVSCQSNQTGHPATSANDSDASNSSYWSADPYPQWWKVDLGANYNLTSIVIRNYVADGRYYHYDIQASVDDVSYTQIAAKTNNNGATDAGDTYTVSSTARYLKVNMSFNSKNTGVHISDFKAYGTLSGTYTIISNAGSGGTISPSGTTTLNLGSSQTYNIAANTGFMLSNVLVDNISVGAVTSYTFSNITANHTISATFIPTYTITPSASSGGTINPSVSGTFGQGSSQTYTITANSGYKISNVLVDNVSVGIVLSYTFSNITANHTISATFVPTSTITSSAGTGGTISPSGTGTFGQGSSQVYTVLANSGYVISNVLVDNVSVGVITSYTFNNIAANHTISVTFVPAFTITSNVGSGGTISPSGTGTFTQGSSQTYTITPNSGYKILDVLVDNVSLGNVTSYTFSNITANHTISVTFVAIFTITSSAGSGGTISPSGNITLNQGSSQSYTITPNTGFQISAVLVDAVSVGTVSGYTFSNIAANHTISVTFVPTFIITSSAGSNGTISPLGNSTLGQGSSQTYTITPNNGYVVSNVLVDNVSVGVVSSYAFSNIATNHTISVTFVVSVINYTINSSAGTGGSISPSGSTIVSQGSSQIYNMTTNRGFQISNVLVDNASVGIVSSYTFSNVLTNHTISASFVASPTSYTITSSAGTGGSINPSGTSTLSPGTSQTYIIAANNGYQITNVLVDNVSVGVVASYSFTNINANHTITVSFSFAGSIALNKPTTCQSSQNGGQSSKAVDTDGSNASYWSADPYPQWWKVDLGANYDVTSIVIRNYVADGRYYHYDIQASTDDISYSQIAAKTNNNVATDGGDPYSVAVTARYLKVNMTFNSKNTGVHITDFSAYGSLTGSQPATYTITSVADTGGSISPLGSSTVNQGNSQIYAITANNGFQISDVLVDNVSVGAISSYSFSNVNANHTISASFVSNPVNNFTIISSAGTGGNISPLGIISVDQGISQTCTVTANSGYQISGVLVDNVSVGAVSSYTFNNINANHTIAAAFSANQVNNYTITSSAGTGGSISPLGTSTVSQGLSQAYTIIADSGYRVSDVLVDNVSVGTVLSYTFNDISANHTIAVSFALISSDSIGSTSICLVKDNKKGMVTFIADDGLYNCVTVFMSYWQRYGLRGTAALVTGWIAGEGIVNGANGAGNDYPDSYYGSWPEWNTLFNNGLDIANHTQSHYRLLNINSDTVKLNFEINGAKQRLDTNIPNYHTIGFVAPFGETTQDSRNVIRQQEYANATTTAGYNSLNPTEDDFFDLNRMAVITGLDVSAANGWIDDVIANNQWVIEMLHGVNGEAWAPVDTSFINQHCAYIHGKLNDILCATYSDAIKYIRERQKASISVISADTNEISLNLTHTLDNSIFNYPLTLKTEVPSSWLSAMVTQNGQSISVTPKNESGRYFIYYNVTPNQGQVDIVSDTISAIASKRILISSLDTSSSKQGSSQPSLKESKVESNNLNIYPNPFVSNILNVRFDLSKRSDIQVSIFNNFGALVYQHNLGTYDSGEVNLTVEPDHLEAGIYLIQVVTKYGIKTARIVRL